MLSFVRRLSTIEGIREDIPKKATQKDKASRREEYGEQSWFARIIATVVTKVVVKRSLFVVVLRSLSCSWSFRSFVRSPVANEAESEGERPPFRLCFRA